MVVDKQPHSPEAEIAVLGGILLDNLSIHHAGNLSTEDFYTASNRLIFSAMRALSIRGDAIDHITLGECLRGRGHLDSIGGAIGLSGLTDGVATSVNVAHYAKIIKHKSDVRKMIATCQQIASDGMSDPDEPQEYISSAMSSVANLSGDTADENEHVGHDIHGLLKSIISPGNTRYEMTGISKIDSAIGGMPKSKAFIVAARPGVGKSSLALSIANHVSKSKPVLYFTLEDTTSSQRIRLVSRMSGIPYHDIELGHLSSDQNRMITLAASGFGDLSLWFRDKKLTSEQITRCSIGWSMQHRDPGLVIVDHLGYIATPGTASDYQKVSENMRNLAYLAKQLGCPVMIVCQLNRKIEDDLRTNENGVNVPRWPRVSDLRDSGKIEEDARAIWMLHREAMYDPEWRDNEVLLLVRKNTSGPKPNILLDNCDIKCCNIG